MLEQRRSALNSSTRAALALSGALILVMVFAGTVLGHFTVANAAFECDGTVTYHISDWTTNNTKNQALVSDIQVAYSLDGGAYVALPDGSFTLGNYLTGFGGTFDGGTARTVEIRANLAPGVKWGDGLADAGPWYSGVIDRELCSTYHPMAPTRIFDTRPTGVTPGSLVSHKPREFAIAGVGGISAGAVAVTGNLTVTGQTQAGYVGLTLVSEPTPGFSILNFPVGDNRANGVTLPLNDGNMWATYVASSSTATANVIFDATGYFTDDATGATFHAMTPARVLDTRPGGTGLSDPFVSRTPREFTVAGVGGVDAAAVAVTGNLTVTDQTQAGYVSLTSDSESMPGTSTLNFPVGDNRANGVTVALNGDGSLWATYVASSASASTNLIFDVTGYFTADATGATFHTIIPQRILDTRPGGTGLSGVFKSKVSREVTVAVGVVAPSAVAVTGNLTVTGQTQAGYVGLTLVSQATPATSTLNFPVGDNRANGVTMPLNGAGDFWATYVAKSSTATTNLLFDVTGFYGP